ncbi:6-phosphofructo-2-kinase/fructose-2,6-biphosphatase [Verticillium alfalfae VaMs.102]|uniref:6-phosphofructo-2-kinase/fructose-2, 6-biphosphatase n=1 Tax=Verticillium alfalfae (strain VaMs.102 / ATCC MYA-4576 / FGSC 10136) TaxID=526221 RepID=C9S8X0_VERA1|nr:6-phosphofructo-2-kinase/fructose-2,6-biphosphatase [Verticillium alfalfae VaMs.102]EEY14047.1 6-phosphofructo-2-kinase/fructose-2,6-biphosphatase [Verticillium alfalfae VaMs.102]
MRPRPELCFDGASAAIEDDDEHQDHPKEANSTDPRDSTAEIAANAPRYRRKSSTFIDGIHDVPEDQDMAPAQLYSTMSGRLFHSGRIAIVMVGLPARGKTLGVKTRIFHLGDYRRATVGDGGAVPEDYFFPNASPASVILRQKILKKCREDIYAWLNHENGQVAIYDAVNPTAGGRRSLAKEFAKHDVQFSGMDPDDAAELYLKRIDMKIPTFEIMEEKELNYIRMINAGRRFFYNNLSFNYLSHRIVFYLTNLHIKSRTTFFARAGTTTEEDSYKADAPLSEQGKSYAAKMSEVLIKHREQERAALVEKQGANVPLPPLTVWTSTRLRTVQTSDYLRDKGYKVRQRSQMSQINPGVCEKMAERAIRTIYPEEVEKHELDPYHHRYPRAEASVPGTLFIRYSMTNPFLNDLLIIAHESVLRVLYAYLMHCSTMDIPFLKFPRDEIIEIIPAAYQNEAKRIHIPGIDPKITPGSPEDIRIPVPGSIPGSGTASGALSPMPGLSSPAEPVERPIEKVVNLTKETVADKVHDED